MRKHRNDITGTMYRTLSEDGRGRGKSGKAGKLMMHRNRLLTAINRHTRIHIMEEIKMVKLA